MGTAAVRNARSGQGANPLPVTPMDEGGNPVFRTANNVVSTRGLLVSIQDGNGTNVADVQFPNVDAVSSGVLVLQTAAFPHLYNGVTFDRARTPNVFKPFSVSVVSLGIGQQTVWTTASTNKRFRFMGANVTSDKACIINFRDGTAASFYASGTVVAATPFATAANIGNGYLSASAGNLLQLDVSTGVPVALTGTIWGTEE